MSLPEGGRPIITARSVSRGYGRGHNPGDIPEGAEERLARVLERRASRPHIPGHGRWEPVDPQRVPDAPGDRAAFNRARLEALRQAEQTVAQQREVLRQTELLLLRQEAALRMAERAAAELAPAPLEPADRTAAPTGPLPEWIREWSASGPALAAARRRYGLSQRDLAKAAHYARSYVADLERDTLRANRRMTQTALARARWRLAVVLSRQVSLSPAAAEGAQA